MMYLAAAGIVFAINLIPAFGPPSWAVLVFIQLHGHLNAAALVVIGAVSAGLGRYVLALASRKLRGRLSPRHRDNLAGAQELLTSHKSGAALGIGLFALSPLPSAQLFEAAGILAVPLLPVTTAFFAGRIVSYSIYVGAASLADRNYGSVLTSTLRSPLAIALEILMIVAVAALAQVDFRRLVARKSPGQPASAPGLIERTRRHRAAVLFGITAAALAFGGLMALASKQEAAHSFWIGGTVVGICYAGASTAMRLWRRTPTVDVLAVLALAGSLAVHEPFAGAMIAAMLGSGQLLDERAAARARRELNLLVERAPRSARCYRDGKLIELPVAEVVIGDRLLVPTGSIVPVDGRLISAATFDESSLTGEARPVERPAGDDVRSGAVNLGDPAELHATSSAADSTYAAVVRLVGQAQAAAAPFVRAADRYAMGFVPFALVIAGLAWLLSGDPVRAVAVLVVATPCPLLLGVPIALMSGISRAARLGVIVKGGDALERLAAGSVMIFDKTGTLTSGRPTLVDVVPAGDWTAAHVLQAAASVDQLSTHPLASAITEAAAGRGLALDQPTALHERHGYGVEATIDGHDVRLGKADWIIGEGESPWFRRVAQRAERDGSIAIYVAIDNKPAGALLLADPIRSDAARMIRQLRAAGIKRFILLTGDRRDIAESVGRRVGVDKVIAEQDPAGKLATIEMESRNGATVMVGDGLNDAPALAAAGVGVALAGSAATASAEAADIVLTTNRVGVLADAIRVAHRSRSAAKQVVWVGMGLSLIAMAVSAVGLLAPAAGAVVQEVIDVLAIVIALRALTAGRGRKKPLDAAELATVDRLQREHDVIHALVGRIPQVAVGIKEGHTDLDEAARLVEALERDLLAHERHDQSDLVPLVTKSEGHGEVTAALQVGHAEIVDHVRRVRQTLDMLEASPPLSAEGAAELRIAFHELYAVLKLHNAQEGEHVSALPRPN